MAFQRETEALSAIAGRLGWDQETMMPPGAAAQRGEEMAAIEGVLHARRTDPHIGDWLAAAVAPDDVARANLRMIARRFARNRKVPARLAAEIARVTSVAQGEWAAARAAGHAMLALVGLQIVIGIVTALTQAPVQIAILHQFGAVILWVLVLRLRFLARYPRAQSLRG